MSWMDDEPVRGRYPDPRTLALTGLDRMRLGPAEQIPPPPIHHLFGLHPVSVGPASTTFAMPASPWLETGPGVFFAGTAALVADAPLGSAVLAVLGPGQVSVTSQVSFSFLRPASVASGRLVARARLIDAGRRVGLSEAAVEDADGRLIAHATSRCFVVDVGVPEVSEPLGPPPPVAYDTPDPYQRPMDLERIPADVWLTRTPLEVLSAVARGDLPSPPFAVLFGGSPPAAEEGRFECAFRASRWFTSPSGTIYGGVLAFIADAAITGAFTTLLPPGGSCAVLDLTVDFVRPGFADDRDISARAEVLHRGSNLAVARAEIRNADGKPLAFALSSAMLRAARPWGALVAADEAAGDASPTGA